MLQRRRAAFAVVAYIHTGETLVVGPTWAPREALSLALDADDMQNALYSCGIILKSAF